MATDPGDAIAPRYPRLPAGGLSDGVVALRCTASTDATGWHEEESDELTVAGGFTGARPDLEEIRRMAARAGLDWLIGA